MNGQKKHETEELLARDLRVGLLGSPYDWGAIDFESFKEQNVALTLTSFSGTRDSNRQDLLVSQQHARELQESACTVQHNEHHLLECEILNGHSDVVSAEWMKELFSSAISRLNEAILRDLLDHDEKYVSTESVIARYGNQSLRVASLLKKPHIHIENEALSYLIDSPWRNEHELDYVISHLVFYLDGDVLRTPYVQKAVYEFGTSIRGVSNSSVVKNLIESFTLDAIGKLDFQTATRLFEIQLEAFEFELARSWSQPRKAA